MLKALCGTIAALALAAPASAAVVTHTYNLDAGTDAFGAMPLMLGELEGPYRVTVRSNRAMVGLIANTAQEVRWRLKPIGGGELIGQDYIVDNQLDIRTGPLAYTIDFLASPATAETKCCWPVGDQMLPYYEQYNYTAHLYTDFGFAAGSDPITVTVTYAPVPEPATWALLIVGFGLVGASLRRFRSVVDPA
jgi:hypothetical protein